MAESKAGIRSRTLVTLTDGHEEWFPLDCVEVFIRLRDLGVVFQGVATVEMVVWDRTRWPDGPQRTAD